MPFEESLRWPSSYAKLRTSLYTSNGRTAEETFFDKDLLHGTDTILRENGTIAITQEWKHGMLNGKWLEFLDDGTKRAEGTFKNGNGTLIRWYKNGAVEDIVQYKNSVQDGKSISWYPNGRKSTEAYFRKGMVDGQLIEWDENGNVTKDEVYKNGFFCYSKIIKTTRPDRPVDELEL